MNLFLVGAAGAFVGLVTVHTVYIGFWEGNAVLTKDHGHDETSQFVRHLREFMSAL